MGDSLDDLDFPHIAELLLRSGAVGRRRPKPRAKGSLKVNPTPKVTHDYRE